ncbi:MAG: metal ABC transporter ATP-binding protein [Deltaproteobacteria bacterium]|nr:metal ABC transporter ATP-binding protein [Deltaproteobacteria bacterium]
MTDAGSAQVGHALAPAAVSLAGVAVGYAGKVVLREVSLAVHEGECLALLGPNGSGKTTLFKTVLGILPPLAGTVGCRADPPVRFGYVPQRERLDPIFPVTVREVVRMGAYRRLRPFKRLAEASARAVAQALTSVGAQDWESRLFNELSGGERQRVLIARALVSRPNVLLLDEPTTGVDLATEIAVIDLVKEFLRTGMAIVMVSHNLRTVEQVANRVIWVHRGELRSGSPEEMLTPEHIRTMLVPEVADHE